MPAHNSLRILFADDEKSLQEVMRSELPRLGHEVTVCPDGKAALKALEKGTFDAAILDLRMPGLTGIEVLEHLKQVSPDTEAIIMTGHASVETAAAAVRLGAFDYVTKPCKLADIEAVLNKVADWRILENKNLALQSRVQAAEGPTLLVGNSPAMTPVHRLIATVAPTDSTVLILGETGTGKGTGLGLAISHRVINQHGGEIEAASLGLNKGSTFTVRLPLQPAEPVKEETLGHAAA